MEENASRAIMIGVGVFVIVLTLSGILLYVNAARKMATVVDRSLNSWDDVTVSNIMDYTGDISIKCTGADFVNFLRKNFLSENIWITISSVATMENIPISYWKATNTGNVSEVKLAKIDRSAEIVMKKNTTTNGNGVSRHLITVEGSVFADRDAYVTDSVWKMEMDSDGRYAYVTDGKVTLEIGDNVKYVTNKNSSIIWQVLGAENGQILLLGNCNSHITLTAPSLRDNTKKLSNYDAEFSGWDDGTGATQGSARCLSFRDVERLTGVDHSSSYSEYGKSYSLSWKNNNHITTDDSHMISLLNGLYCYNSDTKTFEKKEYLDELPTITVDAYTSISDEGAELENLTEKAKNMLTKNTYVFLMDISTSFNSNNFYYTAKCLNKGKITESILLNATNTTRFEIACVVCPVIALNQSAKLTKSGESSWSISD